MRTFLTSSPREELEFRAEELRTARRNHEQACAEVVTTARKQAAAELAYAQAQSKVAACGCVQPDAQGHTHGCTKYRIPAPTIGGVQ